MSKQIKDALRLLVLTVVAGAALGVVYNVTKEPVAEAAQKKEQAAYKSVVPEAEKYEEIDNVDFNDANIATTMQPILADAPGVQSDITIDKVLVGVDGNQVVGTVVNVTSVSYTHLDVYKRQEEISVPRYFLEHFSKYL